MTFTRLNAVVLSELSVFLFLLLHFSFLSFFPHKPPSFLPYVPPAPTLPSSLLFRLFSPLYLLPTTYYPLSFSPTESHMFELHTPDRVFLLSAPSEDEMQSWVGMLQTLKQDHHRRKHSHHRHTTELPHTLTTSRVGVSGNCVRMENGR